LFGCFSTSYLEDSSIKTASFIHFLFDVKFHIYFCNIFILKGEIRTRFKGILYFSEFIFESISNINSFSPHITKYFEASRLKSVKDIFSISLSSNIILSIYIHESFAFTIKVAISLFKSLSKI